MSNGFEFFVPLARIRKEMRARVEADDGRKEVSLSKEDMRRLLDYLDRLA